MFLVYGINNDVVCIIYKYCSKTNNNDDDCSGIKRMYNGFLEARFNTFRLPRRYFSKSM